MNCIRCHVRMTKTDKEGVLIDRCPKCSGIWLDAGELEDIERTRSRERTELVQEARRELAADAMMLFPVIGMCPKCHKGRLQAVKKRGVELDVCPSCDGMFFDESELEAVRREHPAGFIASLVVLFRRGPE